MGNHFKSDCMESISLCGLQLGLINDSLAVGDRSLTCLFKKIRQLAVVLCHRKQATIILPLTHTCQIHTATCDLSRVGLPPVEAVATPKVIIHIRVACGGSHTRKV